MMPTALSGGGQLVVVVAPPLRIALLHKYFDFDFFFRFALGNKNNCMKNLKIMFGILKAVQYLFN